MGLDLRNALDAAKIIALFAVAGAVSLSILRPQLVRIDDNNVAMVGYSGSEITACTITRSPRRYNDELRRAMWRDPNPLPIPPASTASDKVKADWAKWVQDGMPQLPLERVLTVDEAVERVGTLFDCVSQAIEPKSRKER